MDYFLEHPENVENVDLGFLIFVNFFGHDLTTQKDVNFSLGSLVYCHIKKSQEKPRQKDQIIIDKKNYTVKHTVLEIFGNHHTCVKMIFYV